MRLGFGRLTAAAGTSACEQQQEHDPSLWHGPVRWLIAAGALLIVAIALGTATAVYNFRDRALENNKRDLENTGLLLSRHFDQKFYELTRLKNDVAAYLATHAIATPDQFAHSMVSFEVHEMLRLKIDEDFVGDISLIDANGYVLNWSGYWPVPDINVSDRKYFTSLKSSSDPAEQIVELVHSRVTGTWKILFSRRITSATGDFLGIVTRGITPEQLQRFFASLMMEDKAAITFLMRDGTLLARYPKERSEIGRRYEGAASQHFRFSNEPATLKLFNPIDGTLQAGHVRLLRDFPIIIATSSTIDTVLADWRSQTKILVGVACLSALILAALIWLAIRHIQRQSLAAQAKLKLEKNRLHTAINNMTQGLLMFDSQARVVVCNQRYLDMYQLSPDVIVPGLSFRGVIQHRKDTGSFAGSVDNYIDEVLRKVGRSHSQFIQVSDGRAVQIMSEPLADGGWVATHEDITERRRTEERIAHLAHYDALTDLPNRTLFRSDLQRELKRVDRGAQCAVLYIDIDEFKSINDTLGHPVGDELLKDIAQRLRGCVRDCDVVARLGGDEFAIVQTDIAAQSDIIDLVTRIHAAIREPFECLGHRLLTDASIGIALAPRDGTDLDELLKNADLAMYGAKSEGRRTHRFFEPQMDARVKARRVLELDLRQAVADGGFTAGGFEVYYQPLLNLHDDRIIGCEALLRWRHPDRGMISPADFIPVAEEIGVINQLGEWVLSTACHEAASWPDDIRIAVNVSPAQFRGASLPLRVAAALANSGLPARRLELEITEAVLIRDDETALQIMQALRDIGVRIALDDFGTGYSSLSYLQRFPFDKIKIDRAFITDIADAHGSLSIVQAVVNIAASRQMTTTAEGVETLQQKELLRSLGCTEMQGYLFSPPKPAAEVRSLMSAQLAQTAAA